MVRVKEKESAVNPFFRELLTWGVYKPSQGRYTRRATFAALAIGLAIGVWRMMLYLSGSNMTLQYVLPSLLLLFGWWVVFRAVNMPKFADFLIAVEAEMNKVSWPSRGELYRSTIVVLITIILLAFVLYAYDVAWQLLLRALGVIGGAGGGTGE